MSEPYFKKGDYNVICDYSGFKVKASQCRMTWDGFFVYAPFWEARHPQDFVRGKADKQSVPIPRPEQEDIEIDLTPAPKMVCHSTIDPLFWEPLPVVGVTLEFIDGEWVLSETTIPGF